MAIIPGYPKWSPDRTMIAFHGDPDGRPDVLVVPAGIGQPRNITKGTPGGGFPSFSRDGHWIYFSAGLERGELHIWKVPSAGGAPIQVTNNAGSIAIESSQAAISSTSTMQTGQVRCGACRRAVPQPSRLSKAWCSAISTSLKKAFTTSIACRVRRAPSATGPMARHGCDTSISPRRYRRRWPGNLGTIGLGLSATRDGRTVFFTRVDSSTDELLLVDNFR